MPSPRSGASFLIVLFPATLFALAPRPGMDVAAADRADSSAIEYEWVEATPRAPFAGRDGAGALVFRDRLWLLGGWNPRDKQHFPLICNNEVWSSRDGVDWRLEKPNTFLDEKFDPASDWEGRHTGGYEVFQDKLWLVGGDCNQGHYQNDVWNSSDGKSWKLVTANAPWAPRALHCTAVFHDKLWVIGGQTMPGFAPSDEKFYRDVWTSSDGKTWEQVEPQGACWTARGMICGSVVFKDRLWILGGGTYDTPQTPAREYYNDVWSTADGQVWREHVASAPWAARQYHGVAVFDGQMWVLGGYAGADRNDVWRSLDGEVWHEVPETPWGPRHAMSVYVFDDALWVVAGDHLIPDVWKLRRKPAPQSNR